MKSAISPASLACVLFTGFCVPLNAGAPDTPGPSAAPAGAGNRSETLERMAFDDYQAELNRVVKSFATAESIDAMLPLVRNRVRVEPLIRAWYAPANPWKPPGMRREIAQEVCSPTGGNLMVAGWEGSDFTLHTTTLEWTGKTFLVDWESYVGYCEVSWADLAKSRPVTPVLMRVAMESGPRSDYFNEDFTDSAKYRCFTLRDITGDHFLSGYTVRDSEVDKKIQLHLKRVVPAAPGPGASSGDKRLFAIVRVRFLKDGKSARQVEITDMIEEGWAVRPKQPEPQSGR